MAEGKPANREKAAKEPCDRIFLSAERPLHREVGHEPAVWDPVCCKPGFFDTLRETVKMLIEAVFLEVFLLLLEVVALALRDEVADQREANNAQPQPESNRAAADPQENGKDGG